MITVEFHPLLRLGVFASEFSAPLSAIDSPEWIRDLLVDGADAPLTRSEEIRTAVRDLLRHGGYKPTGRGKPASEYLVRAASEDALSSINLPVDVCNVVSLHSGLPISVVDSDLLAPPLKIAIAADEKYVFNASGQEIKVTGLLCLHDRDGPCANGVKDSQRTKTHPATRRVLCFVWGCRAWSEQTDRAIAWYRDLLERAGATCSDVPIGK